jgi:F-type H+-transporting ATPase subunit b
MAAETTTPSGVDHDGNPAAEAAEAVHGHEVPAGTTEVAAHGGEGGGLPQFRFEYWGGQIIWLLIIFAVLYTLLAKVFVPRLRKVLDTRAETIAGALDQARRAQAEADTQAQAAQAEINEGRAQARRVAADAKAKAGESLARSQAAEDERLAGEMDKAEARIRATRDKAMANVQGIAVDTAQAIVEKLTGVAATAAELKAQSPQGAA